ncbi:growth inhibitor PemK [Niveispirillum lacus]|uniref:Growth inhibitor PemK n=1 Tax=Niveispirillum lacus TaxID=1981099 RepID=A0A255YW31_9PROT|nr:type II toxin-antitoxin system PemK/MazF family toxin [Niveispirillum lacus]OYQ33412.1 growth inhibitor PemK [Niveispirillum lacus]
MRRGDIVTVVIPGDYGKPRPALIIQSDLFSEHPSITILPITSDRRDGAPLFRLNVEPDASNGLRLPCQIMVDKAQTVRREKIGDRIGRLTDDQMVAVNQTLALWVGLG